MAKDTHTTQHGQMELPKVNWLGTFKGVIATEVLSHAFFLLTAAAARLMYSAKKIK